jgi:hypothetical protein
MKVGMRLRWLDDEDRDFYLSDLLDFVENADETYAIYRALNPDWRWDLPSQLAAAHLDFIAMKAWVEGGKKGSRPKPIPRPGVVEQYTRNVVDQKRSVSVTRMDEWLAKRRKSA